MQIFISYAREDSNEAIKLYNSLSNVEGLEPWLDKEKLLPGADWELEINNAMENSKYILLLLSSKSVDKEGYVQKEIYNALERLKHFPPGKIFVIPARIDNCVPRHPQLRKLQWVDLYPNWGEGVVKILKSIRYREPTRIQTTKEFEIDLESVSTPKDLTIFLKTVDNRNFHNDEFIDKVLTLIIKMKNSGNYTIHDIRINVNTFANILVDIKRLELANKVITQLLIDPEKDEGIILLEGKALLKTSSQENINKGIEKLESILYSDVRDDFRIAAAMTLFVTFESNMNYAHNCLKWLEIYKKLRDFRPGSIFIYAKEPKWLMWLGKQEEAREIAENIEKYLIEDDNKSYPEIPVKERSGVYQDLARYYERVNTPKCYNILQMLKNKYPSNNYVKKQYNKFINRHPEFLS